MEAQNYLKKLAGSFDKESLDILINSLENFGDYRLADRSTLVITISNKVNSLLFIFERMFVQETPFSISMNAEDRTELLKALKASNQRFLIA